MQAAKMEYKSVYNDKKAEPLRRTLLFVVLAGRVSKVAFAKTVCLTAFFTKYETLTQPTAEGTVIFRPLNRRTRRTRP